MPASVLSHPSLRARSFSSSSSNVALIAVLTALALGTNYAMIDIPNVKLMDSIVFIGAFLFGPRVGLGSAISIWMIYGFINPYGQADPTLLFFLITGECFYAIAGTLLSRAPVAKEMLSRTLSIYNERSSKTKIVEVERSGRGGREARLRGYMNTIRRALRRAYANVLPYGRLSTLFGVIGLLSTFAYDVLTNFGTYAFKTSSLYQALLIGVITGAPFGLLHELTNLVFFATVAPGAIVAARRFSLTIGSPRVR